MKISVTLKILALALQILVLLSSTVSSENNRHPDNLIELAERSEYAYNRLVQWLNTTGAASSLGVNLSSFEDIVDKSPHILEKVYSNATLAMFIGGLQLRQLKLLARVSSNIESDDIISLLKVVALGLNISRVHTGCRDIFSKVFINLAYPSRCSYSISDIDSVLQYAVALGERLPREHLASILSKVYAMRIALQVKEIGEDVFNKVLTDLLYEDSLVLYIVLSDIVKSSDIRIVPVQTPVVAIANTATAVGNVETLGSTITLDDLEKALNMVAELISLAEEYGVQISAEDIMTILGYVLSVDIEKAMPAIRSIGIEDIKRLENMMSAISRKRIEIDIGDILILEGMGIFGIPIIPTMANITTLPKNISDIKTGTAQPRYIYDELYGENLEVAEIAVDIDSYIASKRMMFPSVLAPILHKINVVSIPMTSLSTSTIASHRSITTYPKQTKTSIFVNQGIGRDDLKFYIVLFISTVTGVVAILRPRWFLHTFARIAKMFKSVGGGMISSTQRSRGSVLEFFWILIRRLTLKLGVEIQGSDTHREIYNKIAPKIKDNKSLIKLKDIVRGYEVLRYSDKPTVDESLWLKSVKDLLNEYR